MPLANLQSHMRLSALDSHIDYTAYNTCRVVNEIAQPEALGF
ncbi:unnamed protein product [Schistosoma curassoni]|uniref:Transposase n=1 Tax=Schistosoma curassoni TaxID=6186 RepID=A0A183KQ06_9TREM|nr:unnamed protein product [Schistosoma curassoni]